MPDKQSSHYDIIIIGGGLAGASLACSLRESGLRIAVIEAYMLDTGQQPSYDDRTVALSFGSRLIYDDIGFWPSIAAQAEAIDTIHISDRGHFGVTRLTREQEGVEALGYVVENKRLGVQLYQQMSASENITLYCPAQLESLMQASDHVEIAIRQDDALTHLKADLLVAADGNNSRVLKLLNIGSSRKEYHQVALITNVTPGKKHQNTAYERFTDSGPLAFLPMRDNRCSVVWTLEPEQADYLYALEDDDFLQQLQQRFGYRLGALQRTGVRQLYPLFLQSSTQMVSGRVAIIGNAAHSVHPVAGQGFNLALRDIALLSDLLITANKAGDDIGADSLLQHYAGQREKDIQRVYRFTDTLVRTFSNAIKPLAHVRSLSLFMMDILPDIKHMLAKQSMGLGSGLHGRNNSAVPRRSGIDLLRVFRS